MRRRIRWVAGAMLVAGVACGGRLAWMSWTAAQTAHQNREVTVHLARVTYHTRTEKVMTIGGSVAHGWKDPNHNGYVQRAFAALTAHTPTAYQYIDRTIIGANGTQLDTIYAGKYDSWLNTDQPQVVVISWGLLNDAKPKVPIDQFLYHLQNEINKALAHKAVVFVVTPPVTRASYTQYQTQEQAYVDAEVQFVQKLNNPNVYVFDVFDEMKDYLARNHQTYEPYMGDGWHPNTAGHVLAGKLLYQDIVQTFANQPILFQYPAPAGKGTQSGGSSAAGASGSGAAGQTATGATGSGAAGQGAAGATGSGAGGQASSGATGSGAGGQTATGATGSSASGSAAGASGTSQASK